MSRATLAQRRNEFNAALSAAVSSASISKHKTFFLCVIFVRHFVSFGMASSGFKER